MKCLTSRQLAHHAKMKYGVVKFNDNENEYRYMTMVDDLKHGDLVVVEAMNFYAVATFVGYSTPTERANKYIVQKLDIESIEEEKTRSIRKQELMEKIDERLREAEKFERIIKLVEKDTVLKGLMDELNNI